MHGAHLQMCQRVLLPYIDACCAELKPAKGRLFGHAARVQRDKHQGLSVSVKMLIVGRWVGSGTGLPGCRGADSDVVNGCTAQLSCAEQVRL